MENTTPLDEMVHTITDRYLHSHHPNSSVTHSPVLHTTRNITVQSLVEASLVALLSLVAIVGNTCLWIVILDRRYKLRKTSNALILCLSGADLLVSSLAMPVIVYTILRDSWTLPPQLCVAFGFLTMLTFIASVMSLAAISINRYVIVCRPLEVASRYTPRKTVLWIVGVWLLSGLLASPPLIGWCEYNFLPDQSFCFANWPTSVSYTFFMVGVCFGGPCSSMTLCYIKIFREIKTIKSGLRLDDSRRETCSSPSLERGTKTQEANKDTLAKLQIVPKKDPSVVKRRRQVVTGQNSTRILPNITTTMSNRAHCYFIDGQSPRATSQLRAQRHTEKQSRTPPIPNPLVNYASTMVLTQFRDQPHVVLRTQSLPGGLGWQTSKSITRATTDGSESKSSESISNIDTRTHISNGYSKDKKDVSNKCENSSNLDINHTKLIVQASESVSYSFKKDKNYLPRYRIKKAPSFTRYQREEIKLTLSLLIAIIMFCICWLPYCITMFFSVFKPGFLSKILSMASLILGCMNSCINPLIYALVSKQFKRAFKALFTCQRCRCHAKSEGL